MTRDSRKIVFQRVGFYGFALLLCIGAWFLIRYENAKLNDTLRMSSIVESQSVLSAYSARHGIYPAVAQGGLALDASQSACVSKRGIVNPSSDDCREYGYGLMRGELEYHSLGEDRKTPCSDRCPWYEIGFSLQTNAIASKGNHFVTPEGLQ